MLQFLVTAYDGTDAQAPERRKDSKEEHVELGHQMIRSGNILFSTAILDDNEQTVGSMRVMQFNSRDELDAWLETEPYVINEVWQNVDVRRCRMGPAFEWVTLQSSEDIKLDPS